MSTARYLRELSQRCRYWSRNCYDLAAAHEFRKLADELEHQAKELERSEAPSTAANHAR